MEYYTPEEAAAKLKIAKRTMYKWLRQGRVIGKKLGNMWRIPETEINRILEGESEQPAEAGETAFLLSLPRPASVKRHGMKCLCRQELLNIVNLWRRCQKLSHSLPLSPLQLCQQLPGFALGTSCWTLRGLTPVLAAVSAAKEGIKAKLFRFDIASSLFLSPPARVSGQYAHAGIHSRSLHGGSLVDGFTRCGAAKQKREGTAHTVLRLIP